MYFTEMEKKSRSVLQSQVVSLGWDIRRKRFARHQAVCNVCMLPTSATRSRKSLCLNDGTLDVIEVVPLVLNTT